MNYLTNYYKNLCEQLQEQVNFLNNQLNEMLIASPGEKYLSPRLKRRLERTASGKHEWVGGETEEQALKRQIGQSSRRSRLLNAARVAAETNPTEYGDLYKRLTVDMSDQGLRGLYGGYKSDTSIGLEREGERDSVSHGGLPNRAENIPGTPEGSGYFDDAPEFGYLTPREARILIKAAKKHGYK